MTTYLDDERIAEDLRAELDRVPTRLDVGVLEAEFARGGAAVTALSGHSPPLPPWPRWPAAPGV